MKIIFDKYGGIKDIQDRKLLVQSSIGSNFVDIYYQDEEGNFADPDINLATIAFKRADTFEISERTCALVKEELTNNPLYFRYILKEDELAINGELQMTVRLKQVVFDPEDDSKVLLIKQRAMGKITAHIYEAVGENYENFDVVDGRILQLELWQANFESDYYNADQIDAKLVLERQATNDSLDDHNTSNEAHEDIRQALANNASAINTETLNRQSADNALDERIDVLEAFKNNLDTDITDEIAQAVNAEKTAREEADTVLDNKKVDKVDGKSLIADTEIERLALVDNYDDSEVKQDLSTHTGDTVKHVTQTDKNKWNALENYDDTAIKADIAEAKAIAEGKSRARVFATKSALDTWLLDSENVELLQIGDNFYIEETDKPDYWWNGTTIKELETQKVDLTEYAKKTELLTLGTTSTDAYRGDLGQIAYNHSQSAHAPSNAQKNVQSDWNQTDDTKDDYIKNKPTIPTIPDLELNDNTETSGKYISKIEVDGTNKHKLNITKKDLPQGFSGDYNDLTNKPTLFSGDYNDLTNKPTIPTVPTISTSITTDATDDTKTASPKAVKTYVDNVLGDIETLLEAI